MHADAEDAGSRCGHRSAVHACCFYNITCPHQTLNCFSYLVSIPPQLIIIVQEPALRQAATHSFLSDPPLSGHGKIDRGEGQGLLPLALRLIPAALQAAGLIAAMPPHAAAGDAPLYGGPHPAAAGPSQMNALGCVRILLVALGDEF